MEINNKDRMTLIRGEIDIIEIHLTSTLQFLPES